MRNDVADVHAGGQPLQHGLHGIAHAANARLAVADRRVDGEAGRGLGHRSVLEDSERFDCFCSCSFQLSMRSLII